jgi:rhodanese-related sulfurtransferase
MSADIAPVHRVARPDPPACPEAVRTQRPDPAGAGHGLQGWASTPREVVRDELRTAMAGGGVSLVEALGPMYFADAHLPGAVNIPPDLVAELAPELLPDTARTVITYCSSPASSSSVVVARRLLDLGYADVARYAGGKQDWIAAGLPAERDTSAQGVVDSSHDTVVTEP